MVGGTECAPAKGTLFCCKQAELRGLRHSQCSDILPLPSLFSLPRSPEGYYRTPHPLVPGTAICQSCEGCPAAQCGASGCTAW